MVSNLNSAISNGVLTDENLMQNVEQPPHWHLSKTYKSKRHKTALYIGCRLIWYSSRTHFPPCLHSPKRTPLHCPSSDMMSFKPQWHLWLKLSCTVSSLQGIDAEYRTNSISSFVLCACGNCRTVITVCYLVMECWIHHWSIFLCSRKRSKFPTAMFLVILTMFVLDTAMCILDVHNAIQEITLTLTSTAPLLLTERYSLLSTIPWSVTNSLFAYMVSSHIARTRITLWLSQIICRSALGML